MDEREWRQCQGFLTTVPGVRCSRETCSPLGFCGQHERILFADIARLVDAGEPVGELSFSIRAAVQREVDAILDARMDRVLEDRRARWVYYIHREGHIKIGSAANVEKRLRDLERGGVIMPVGIAPGPAELLATHRGGIQAEKTAHRRFKHLRVAGEWFEDAPELRAYIAEVSAKAAARGRAA